MTHVTRPSHLSPGQQTEVIHNVLAYAFGEEKVLIQKLPHVDQIDLYDPPEPAQGFPKVVKLTVSILQSWEGFLRNVKAECVDFTFCKLDVAALSYLVSLNTFKRIVTTLVLRSVEQPLERTAQLRFENNSTKLRSVRNAFWIPPKEELISVAGVTLIDDGRPFTCVAKGPHKTPPFPWTDLMRWRSAPVRALPPEITFAAPTVNGTATAKKGFAATLSKVVKKAQELGQEEVLFPAPVIKPPVLLPFDERGIVKLLAEVFNLREEFIQAKAQKLESLRAWEGRISVGIPVRLEISRVAMQDCIIPLAKATRTQFLDFTSCLLCDDVLVDLMAAYQELEASEIRLSRPLTQDEKLAGESLQKLILHRNPHFKWHTELFSFVVNPYKCDPCFVDSAESGSKEEKVGAASKDPNTYLKCVLKRTFFLNDFIYSAVPQRGKPFPLMEAMDSSDYERVAQEAQKKIIASMVPLMAAALNVAADDLLNRPAAQAGKFLLSTRNHPLTGPIHNLFAMSYKEKKLVVSSTNKIERGAYAQVLQPIVNAFPSMTKLNLSKFNFEIPHVIEFLTANPKIRFLIVSDSWVVYYPERWIELKESLAAIQNPPTLWNYEGGVVGEGSAQSVDEALKRANFGV